MAARILPLLCLVAGLLASSCSAPAAPAEPAPAPARIYGLWDLVELHGQPRRFPDGERPYLQISPDGKLAGFGGVNRFTGEADLAALDQGRFEAGPLAATKMAGSAEAMTFERRFFGALEGATDVQVVDQMLELSAGGASLARFTARH